MEIVEIDEQLMEKLPNIFQLIYNVYGLRDVLIYVAKDQYITSFICTDGEIGLFINNNGYRLFKTDKDYNVLSFQGKKYQAFYGDDITFADRDNNEYILELKKTNKEDNNGYDGMVVYTKLDKNNDVYSQIYYPHVFKELNGKPHIYQMYLKDFDSLYIEEEFTKHKFRKGLIPKRINAFNKVSFERDMIGYNLTLINEQGLLPLLMKGSYNLERDNKITRYIKSYYIDHKGIYHDFGLLGTLYKEEDIKSLMRKYKISSVIDKELIDLYNGNDFYLDSIRKILEELKNDKTKQDLGISMSLKVK